MSETLERRYRKLLRILPRSYREAREEELLGVLMEGSAEGRRWPEVREALSVARLGLRARLPEAAGADRVPGRVGAIMRAVAIAGTLLLSFTGAVQLAAVMRNASENPAVRWGWSHPLTVEFSNGRGYSIAYAEVPAFWVAVLALIAFGRWRTARALAVGLFLLSVSSSDSIMAALREETLLAAVVTAAMFAVRGVHAEAVRGAGLAGVTVSVGLAAWVGGMFGAVGKQGRPVLRALMDLQAWEVSDDRHVLAAAVLAVAVVCVVARRSVVWPVALAVVAVAALAPVVLRGAVHPESGLDQVPLTFLAGALLAVAVFAVVKDRRSGRREQPASPS